MTMKINIPSPSILKLQITPIHARIKINLLFKNGDSIVNEKNYAFSNIPFNYNIYEDLCKLLKKSNIIITFFFLLLFLYLKVF